MVDIWSIEIFWFFIVDCILVDKFQTVILNVIWSLVVILFFMHFFFLFDVGLNLFIITSSPPCNVLLHVSFLFFVEDSILFLLFFFLLNMCLYISFFFLLLMWSFFFLVKCFFFFTFLMLKILYPWFSTCG